MRRSGGDQNHVERRLLGPARVAVAVTNRDVLVAELRQTFAGRYRQTRHDLDAEYLGTQFRQNGRLVAGPDADLQRTCTDEWGGPAGS